MVSSIFNLNLNRDFATEIRIGPWDSIVDFLGQGAKTDTKTMANIIENLDQSDTTRIAILKYLLEQKSNHGIVYEDIKNHIAANGTVKGAENLFFLAGGDYDGEFHRGGARTGPGEALQISEAHGHTEATVVFQKWEETAKKCTARQRRHDAIEGAICH